MWSTINGAISAAVDAWLWAFQSFPPVVQFLALALPVTLLALLVYRYTSDQQGIRAVKNRLKAYLLELRLFKDDLRVQLHAQGQILKNSTIYMAYALVPMSVMIVPVVLLMIQVESRYAFRPLQPGESTIVEVTVDTRTAPSELEATLLVPLGLTLATPPLRMDEERSILWRVRADEPGDYTLRIRIGEQEYSKRLRVGERGDLSPAIYAADDIRTLAYPLEPALAAASLVSSVELAYPRDRAVFAGLSSASWILFVASLAFGYLLRGLFGVTF